MCLYSSLHSSRVSSCVTTKQEAKSFSITANQEANSCSTTTQQEANSFSITTPQQAFGGVGAVGSLELAHLVPLTMECPTTEIVKKNARAYTHIHSSALCQCKLT